MPTVRSAPEPVYEPIFSAITTDTRNFKIQGDRDIVWFDTNGDLIPRATNGATTTGDTVIFYSPSVSGVKNLNFVGNPFDFHLSDLPVSPSLETVNFSSMGIQGDISILLRYADSMKTIDLRSTATTLLNPDDLSRFPNLTSLDLRGALAIEIEIRKLLKHTWIRLAFRKGEADLTIADLPPVSSTLAISYSSISGNLGDLPNKNITIFNFVDCPNLDRDFQIESFTKLRTFNIPGCGVTEAEADALVQRLYNNRTVFESSSIRLDLRGNNDVSGAETDTVADGTGYGFINGLRLHGWTVLL